VNLFIPVEFEGEGGAPGIRKGGVLTVVRPEVELNVVAGDIPEKLVANIEGMEIGDTLTISKIELPQGARPTIDRDFVICNISAPSGLRAADEEEEGAAEEPDADEVPTVGDEAEDTEE
jgi:large subunit ribosomal protein L25